jgi:hypothetical protein
MEQIQAIRSRHGRMCSCDDFPCDAIQLAQRLELAVKALENASCSCIAGRHPETVRIVTAHRYDCSWREAQETLAAIAEVK